MSEDFAPGILGLPIDYYKFKRWSRKRIKEKEILKENPDISREDLKIKMTEWEKEYDKWEEADYKKWKETQEKETT